MARWDLLIQNANLATMTETGEPYGALHDAALAVEGERIAWLGPIGALPTDAVAGETLDADGGWLLPGLIDCHTHLVFAGDRAREFELRLAGATYEEIARAGGGIAGTVRATRAADASSLEAAATARLAALQREGVTTVEIKSGYGLEPDTERRMLAVARALGRRPGVDVVTSFLGAHALPPEAPDDRTGYLHRVCEVMIPELAKAGLADAVDAFGERIAFTPAECAQVFEAARRHGLPVKLHADQLSDQDGAALAARYGALSADHLEYTSEAGARAMAAAGTTAVLLPGAFYTLRERQLPPIDAFRRHGVPMAVATDCNPGSSPLCSLLTALNLACTLFRLTPEEALQGATVHAARALGLEDRGTLEVGKRADLTLWPVEGPAALVYWIGGNAPSTVLKDGKRSVSAN